MEFTICELFKIQNMKKLIYILSFFIIGATYAQDRPQQTRTTQDRNIQNQRSATQFQLDRQTDYSFNNQNYRFSPDNRGITITRDRDGRQTPHGTLRSTTDDGYYIMTTTTDTGEERTSFGSFDDEGNFQSFRYDANSGRVIEENFRTGTPRRAGDDGRMNRPTNNPQGQGTNPNRTGNN